MNSYCQSAGIALYSVAQIKEIEQRQVMTECLKEPYANRLMEAAGKSAFDLMKATWPKAKRVLVISGKGNNGGDGYVVARLAANEHFKVTLCQLVDDEAVGGDALIAFNQLPSNGVERVKWSSVDMNQAAMRGYDVIIDAMLGTGIKGALLAPYPEVIEAVNQSNVPVLSIDIPSGLEADSGYVQSIAVKAKVTATFIGYKKGLFTGVAANYSGKVSLYALGVQEHIFQDYSAMLENWSTVQYKLYPRQPASHKGENGHCLVIGGAQGMIGAAVLATSAAARTGSGLVSAIVENAASTLVTVRPEVMAKDVGLNEIEAAGADLNKANVIVVGPGLGKAAWADLWMNYLYTDSKKIKNDSYLKQVKVIDADGLNWLARHPNFDPLRVLTPHPGEAGRLLGISSEAVNRDRFAAADAIAQKFGGICVLKGAGTLISDGAKCQKVCSVGNPGMASGGMGDVLSGIIGALIAQGFSLLDSALLGVCVHGEAADRVAGEMKIYRGMLASDLLTHLPVLMNPLNHES